MYSTKQDVDEHVNKELDKLISKLEKTEERANSLKVKIPQYVKGTKQSQEIEEALSRIISKCDTNQKNIFNKKK